MHNIQEPQPLHLQSFRRWLSQYRLHISLFLFVFGLRMWAHAFAGSPIPFYDQWVFAFNNLAIVPSAHDFAFLRVPHNEHRPITTQCIELIGLWWNGYYDVRFTLAAGAFIRALNACIAFQLLRGSSKISQGSAWAGCFFIFAIPYSGYNALNGMQVSMYMVDTSLLFSIWLLYRWPINRSSLYPALFLLNSIFGLLSFTQAILVPASTISFHIVSKRPRWGFFPAWIVSVVLSTILFVLAPKGESGTLPSLTAFLQVATWPMPSLILSIATIIMYIAGVTVIFDHKTSRSPAIQTLISIAIFSGGSTLLLALKRSDDFNMRHFESVAPLSIVTLAIVASSRSEMMRKCSYVFFALLCLAWARPLKQSYSYFLANHVNRENTIEQVKQYIIQGKMQEFGNIITKKITVHDYSFFLDPLLQYSPGVFAGHNIDQYRISLLKMPPELFPIRRPTNLSLFLYALVQFYGIFLVVAMALLIPWSALRKHPTNITTTAA